MKHTIQFFFFLLLALVPPLQAQEEKPDAAVQPIAVMGEISTVKQGMIFTRLTSLLTKNYRLVSQEDFIKA